MHQLHFGRLDTAWNGNCSGLHIYNDTGKLVLRKPDGRAPARRWQPHTRAQNGYGSLQRIAPELDCV